MCSCTSLAVSRYSLAGKDPQPKIADFDCHYMPDGVPEPEASVTGNTGKHRSNLKRKAKGIARSLPEVFAYLMFNMKVWIYLYYLTTGASLMCTAQSRTIRAEWFIMFLA
jgi:hypothetical protein